MGLLDLGLAPVAGATRVVRQFHRTPLYVLRPIYLDRALPGMAFVYLQQQGGGMVQGDRYRVDVEVAAGGQAHLTTQSATKVFGMPSGYATQLVNVSAGPGALLEYLPEPVIPFRASRFFTETTVTVDPQATVLVAETTLPGRVARGEWHDYDVYCSWTRFLRPDGAQVAVDALQFGDTWGRADSPARLGRYGVSAALFALAPPLQLDGLQPALVTALDRQCPDVLAGVTALPFDAGVVVRILGTSSIPVRKALLVAWDTARRHVVGAPAPDRRRD
ncbi:MAG: urease accessory protein UreD [Actinomycetes bacterium]